MTDLRDCRIAELADQERRVVMGLADGLHPDEELTDADLTDVPARKGLEALRTLRDQGAKGAVDELLLFAQMRREGATDEPELLRTVAPVTRTEFRLAVRQVAQDSLVRRIRRSLRQASDLVENQGRGLSPEDLREKVSNLVAGPFAGAGRDLPVTDDEALIALRDRLSRGVDREGYVSSGCHDLDGITGGAGPGMLILLAARPGVGKSAWALQWATHIIRTIGPVLLVTLEMTAEETAVRMAQQMCRARRRELQPDQVERARLLQRQGPLFIHDSGTSLQRLAARIASLKMRRPDLKAVFIDYLGLLRDTTLKGGSTYEQVSSVARRLKDLAQEHRLPIIALHQLHRGVQSRQDRRPELSDLRDSGVIEEAANQVLFLYREGYDQNHREPGPAELIIRKNRSGSVGTVHLHWDPEFVSFYPAERRLDDPNEGRARPGWFESFEGRHEDLYEEACF